MMINNLYKILLLICIDQYFKNTRECHRNYGINFGILIPFPSVLNTLALIYLLYYYNVYSYLIYAGGISNLIDRLYYGYVNDYIYLPEIKICNKSLNYVCNLADIYVTIGIFEYVYNNGLRSILIF